MSFENKVAAVTGAAIAYAKSLALELGAKASTVNAINSGTTDAPMTSGALFDDEWQKRWRQAPLGGYACPKISPKPCIFWAVLRAAL